MEEEVLRKIKAWLHGKEDKKLDKFFLENDRAYELLLELTKDLDNREIARKIYEEAKNG